MSVWTELRRNAPVAMLEPLKVVAVTRFDDVKRVARDAAAFSAAVDAPLARTIGPNFMYADGERHRRLRSIATPLLQPTTLATSHATWIEARVSALVDALPREAPVDLMTTLAEPLAIGLLRGIIGLDAVADDDFRRWFKTIAAGAANFECDEEKDAAASGVMAEIRDVAEITMRSSPQPGTLLSEFADLPRSDLLGAIGLFLIGGLQEPRDLLGLALIGLLDEGESWGALRAAPAQDTAVAAAVEEAARWGSPVGTVTRVATRDVELSGVTIAAGSTVAGVLASANRDERHWTLPERFDVDRREGPHLAYGSGAHACVGAAAARILTKSTLLHLLDVAPAMRLAEMPVVPGYEFRGPTAVLVHLE